MKHLKTIFACMLTTVLSIGQIWATDPDVTYDFTGSDWSVSNGTLTNGTVSFTGEGGANFKMNNGYFMMGKSGAYITFPAYPNAVEKIVVTGNSGASGSVGQNIFVGDNAASTSTTGATGTNTYIINSSYQAAGTIYKLKVTTAHNTQITKIEIFYVGGSDPGDEPGGGEEPGEDPYDGSILEITKTDFTTSSYDENAGDHQKSGITFTTAKVYQSGGGIQFQKTNGLLYNKTDLGEIAKIEITTVSGKSNNLEVYSGTTENPSTTQVTGSASGSVTTYTFASGNGYFAIKGNSTGASNVDPIKIYYVYTAPEVATPSISGATPFATTTTVTLGCTTDGAAIYYTTDGTNPSSSSTLYENPFELNASAAVKAIAIKGGSSSSVASKEFTKVTSYTTLADIFAKATEVGSTVTDIYVTFGGWKVSAKNNNNAFLTDGTNGAVIYGSGHGFNAGDVLTGTVACKVQLYKGFAELTSLTKSTTGLTVTAGSVGDPVVKTWSQLSAVNTGALVKLENLTYDGSNLSDGTNTIPTYTTFYTASFESGKSYNLTGVYQYFESAGQILPRNASDVEDIIETYTVTYNNAPDNGTLTIKNGDDVVNSGSSVNEGTVLTIVTTPAEGYKLAGVTVNGNAYTETTLTLTEDVTIAASFEENAAPLVTTYILSEIGVETSHLNGQYVGDKVTLPSTATTCSKAFKGWTTKVDFEDGDESLESYYEAGAEYTLAADNKLYAVYATETPGAATNYPIDFENEAAAFTNWMFTNITPKQTDSGVGTHGGTYFGVTDGKATAIIVTQNMIANPSSLTVYVSKKSTNTSSSTWYIQVSEDGLNWTNVESVDGASMSKGAWVELSADLSSYSNVYVRVYYSGSTAVRCIDDLVLSAQGSATYSDYSTDCQAQVATPTFSPAAGTYTEVQSVTITSETTGATIYYTTNGDNPTTSSTAYSSAIEVGEDMTIKAIAVKNGMANSAVATAAYTINLPLSTMDQIYAAATAAGSTATDANIKFNNWVVSGVSTNAKNVFVTDGTKGLIIFDSDASMGFSVGDVLSGTVTCKVQLYKGAAELTNLSSETEGLNIATGGSVTPEVKAISALSGINTGAPVTINSVQFDGEYLTDGANSIKPYSTLFAYDALTEDTYYNVTGIYQQFDATKEILPRSAADIEEVSLSDPEISYTPASATIELGAELPGTTFANPHELAISYSSNNTAVATVSNAGVISLAGGLGTAVITASFAGNATYAAANVTYTITVNPASVSENVVILAVYDEKYYAMSTTNANNAFTAIEVEYDGTQVTVKSETEKAAIQWTKKTSGNNTTFQDADGKYMKSADGTTMSLQDAVCNWVWDANGEYYKINNTSRTFFFQNETGFKNFATSNFGKSGYSGKAQVIAIAAENIVLNTKADPQLAYNPTSVTLTVGGTFTPATLTYATGFDGLADVTYESSNTNLATVEGSVVFLVANAIGTATITATFAGNTNYQSGSASYTITVNEAADDFSGIWTLASSVAAGDRIIIASIADASDIITMGAQASSNRSGVASTIDGTVLTPAAATKSVTLVDAGDDKFALQLSNGKYLYASSNSSNQLKETDAYAENGNAKWTITFNDGAATITAQGSNSRNVMRYNPNNGSPLFACYASSSTTGTLVTIYKQGTNPEPVYTEVRNELTAGYYYTMCLDKAVTHVRGASIWRVLSKAENGSGIILEEVTGTLDAGRPYFFYATADKMDVVYTGDEVDAPLTEGNNGLVGSFAQEIIAQSENNFILYNNMLYFVNSTAYVGANRAYLNMADVPVYSEGTPAPGRRRVTMQTNGEQVATGMDEVNVNSEVAVKTLIDGQLFILCGQKMYDTTGRLVK